MRKYKIGLYIALLAIIIGGAPYFTGYLVQTKFEDVTRVLSEFEPLEVTILEYHRGLRKSYAKTQLSFTDKKLQALATLLEPASAPSSQAAELTVIVEHEIRHGPFVQLKDGNYRDWLFALATIQSKLFLTEQAKQVLTSEFGSPELLQLNAIMNIEGDVLANIEGRILKWKQPDGKEHVFWKGVRSSWQLNRDLKHFHGEMILPGFDFEWEGVHFYAEDLMFKTERHKSQQGLWLGKGTMSIHKAEINDSKHGAVMLMALNAGGLMDMDNGMLDSAATISMEQFKLGDQLWGPINCAFSVKNLDSNAMRSLMQLKFDSKTSYEAYSNELIRILPNLLKNRPEFNLENMNIHAEEGDLKGQVNLAVGGAQAHDVNNMPAVVQSIAAKVSFLIPKEFLKKITTKHLLKRQSVQAQNQQPSPTVDQLNQQAVHAAEQMINQEIAQGLLVEKDHSYAFEMEFLQGIVKVNGKTIEKPKLFNSVSTTPDNAN